MLCKPSCRVRCRVRHRRPAVPLRCRAMVRPSAFLCRLSSSVGRYTLPDNKSRLILRRVTVYHCRNYRPHSHRDSNSRLKAEVTTADPDAEVGTRSAGLSRSAGGSTGRIRFLSVHLILPVSAGLLITHFAGWWHAIRYYVWEPPNIHHGWHHTTILTILHTRVPFRTSLSPNPTRWRSSESLQKPIRNL